MTDTDGFLVTRRGRMAFVAVLMASVVAIDALVAGVAGLLALELLTAAGPERFRGLEPVAAAWRIAAVLVVLGLAYLVLSAPFVWRRGLGELISTGRLVPYEPRTATVLAEVWAVLERAAAAGVVIACQLPGSPRNLILSTAATTAALVAARVLFRRWLRVRDRRRQDRPTGEGEAV